MHGGDEVKDAGKVIELPFIRSTKIENAVNTLNVAVKNVETEAPKVDSIYEGYMNISNKINNLIINIHGESQLIELLAKNEKNSDLKKIIDSIKQNCLKLTKSLNNMIELQKIKENQLILCFNNVNIVEVIDNIVINTSKNIKDKKIIFDTNVEEKFISCDVDEFQKAILILLSNAIKFSGEKEVLVNLNICENNINIAISFKSNNSKLLYNFIDEMDNFKLNTSEDMSVCYYLCKSIIELHEGNIDIEVNGDEICFLIQLPCEDADSIYYLFRNDITHNNKNLTEQIQIEFSDIYDL
jgi:signal transduction histidine kinase